MGKRKYKCSNVRSNKLTNYKEIIIIYIIKNKLDGNTSVDDLFRYKLGGMFIFFIIFFRKKKEEEIIIK